MFIKIQNQAVCGIRRRLLRILPLVSRWWTPGLDKFDWLRQFQLSKVWEWPACRVRVPGSMRCCRGRCWMS